MASAEHLSLLLKGSIVWNDWRRSNLEIEVDLREADLHGANLTGTDLRGADFSEAHLSGAHLSGADLSLANLHGARLRMADLSKANLSYADLGEADLIGANLSRADLRRVDLSEADFGGADLREANFLGANLRYANLTRANLCYANLTAAFLWETIFGNVDLTKTIGLDKCLHLGPSIIDFRTLSRSENLPLSFLRGCGLSDRLIEYLPSLPACDLAVAGQSNRSMAYQVRPGAKSQRRHPPASRFWP